MVEVKVPYSQWLHVLRCLFICTIFSLQEVYAVEQHEWELTKNKKNVEVYTRYVSGSSMKAFKGITVLEANSLAHYHDLVMQVDGYSRWMHTLKSAELRHHEDQNVRIVYVVFDTPWPLDNRDVYLRNTIVRDAKTIQMQIEAIDGALSDSKQLVRIPSLTSTLTFEQMTDDKVRVTYQGHADPGGNVPSWAANRVVEDTPYHTLLNLHAY